MKSAGSAEKAKILGNFHCWYWSEK